MVQEKKYYYLVEVVYDGRNLHGVQEVTGFKTLSGLIHTAFSEKFVGCRLSIMRSSRLDKGVSARALYLHLIIRDEFNQFTNFVFKDWLRAFHISEYSMKFLTVLETSKFHLLSKIKIKTYRYFFSPDVGNQPFVVHVKEMLNDEILNWAVKEFVGVHHFKSFSIRGRNDESDLRHIIDAKIICGDFDLNPLQNIQLKNVWCFEVTGEGFMRGQVRMMMGALLKLCSGQLSKDEFSLALQGKIPTGQKAGFKVPATGLILWKTELDLPSDES